MFEEGLYIPIMKLFDKGQPNTVLTVDQTLSGNVHLQLDYRERLLAGGDRVGHGAGGHEVSLDAGAAPEPAILAG